MSDDCDNDECGGTCWLCRRHDQTERELKEFAERAGTCGGCGRSKAAWHCRCGGAG